MEHRGINTTTYGRPTYHPTTDGHPCSPRQRYVTATRPRPTHDMHAQRETNTRTSLTDTRTVAHTDNIWYYMLRSPTLELCPYTSLILHLTPPASCPTLTRFPYLLSSPLHSITLPHTPPRITLRTAAPFP